MRKYFTILLVITGISAYGQTNTFPASGNVGIGTTSPDVSLHVLEPSESKPGGTVVPTKSVFKLSRAGSSGYNYPESAEFRIGHGGPTYWGSQLDLYINGASNQTNIPDQQVMTWQYNGNVGVGTTNPQALLDVGRYISNGTIGTVLARQSEGDNAGAGTNLNVRAWTTQNASFNGKSFSLEHSFYGSLNSAINFYRGGGTTGGYMTFATNNGTEQMRIDPSGNVGIGTTNPTAKLAVAGSIQAYDVTVKTGWADYVFDSSYELKPLTAVANYIQENKHLPNIPSAEEVSRNGIALGEMNKKLLEKVEELTLYVIKQNEKSQLQEEQIRELKSKSEDSQKLKELLQKQSDLLEKQNKRIEQLEQLVSRPKAAQTK